MKRPKSRNGQIDGLPVFVVEIKKHIVGASIDRQYKRTQRLSFSLLEFFAESLYINIVIFRKIRLIGNTPIEPIVVDSP